MLACFVCLAQASDLAELLQADDTSWPAICVGVRPNVEVSRASYAVFSGRLNLQSLADRAIEVMGIPVGFPVSEFEGMKIEAWADLAVISAKTQDSQSALIVFDQNADTMTSGLDSSLPGDRLHAQTFGEHSSMHDILFEAFTVTPSDLSCEEGSLEDDVRTYQLLVLKGIATRDHDLVFDVSGPDWSGYALCSNIDHQFELDFDLKKDVRTASGRLRVAGSCEELSVEPL